MSEWKTIDSAPRDETDILLYIKYEDVPVVGYWSRRQRWIANKDVYFTEANGIVEDNIVQDYVTHWMPLPEPPK